MHHAESWVFKGALARHHEKGTDLLWPKLLEDVEKKPVGEQ